MKRACLKEPNDQDENGNRLPSAALGFSTAETYTSPWMIFAIIHFFDTATRAYQKPRSIDLLIALLPEK